MVLQLSVDFGVLYTKSQNVAGVILEYAADYVQAGVKLPKGLDHIV